MHDLQSITDHIATRLDRAVYLEDTSFRPLATSVQVGHIDDARIEALLARKPTKPHLQYFIERGVPRAREPLRIPASEEHELAARVVIPVLERGRVLARMWLIDSSPVVTSSDIAFVHEAAAAMAPFLDDRSRERERRVEIGSQLLQGMYSAGRKRREELFRQLNQPYGAHSPRGVYSCVIRVSDPAAEGNDSSYVSRMEELLASFTDLLDVHRPVGLLDTHSLRALIAPRAQDGDITRLIADAARGAVALHGLHVDAIGVSDALTSPHDLERSHEQADFAARVSERLTRFRGAARWEDLGEYRLFAGIEWNRAGVAQLHPGVAALLDSRTPLASTLLCYLEREGDTEAAARVLNVHRTTFYYRIRRANEILGGRITGPERFVIHAALKFADLIGRSERATGVSDKA